MGAIGYAVIYVLALVPGLPVGFALFGRRHAAGWVAGAAFGYFFTALALWAAIAVGHPSAVLFAVAWALALGGSWLATRAVHAPLLNVPAWTARDTRALVLTILLALVIAVPPFARLGESDAQGNRYYRAYFTADFVWHMAVTAEIQKFAMPPRNMYMPHRPLHYYWAYFLVPGAAAGAGPRVLTDIQTDLTMNAIGTAALLTASIFIVAWLAVPRAWAAAAATGLAIVASSAEGFVALASIVRRGAPLAAVRDLNIDAISNWWFSGLRVDGLPRCFWWVPQHSTAYILGLAAMAAGMAGGSGAPIGAHLFAGLALAGAIAFNPFVGAIFAVAWGTGIAIDALRSPQPIARLARAAIAVVPAAAGLAWTQVNQMTGGAHGMLLLGLLGNARNQPLFNLLLSLGPALAPAAVGLAAAVRERRARPLAIPCVLIALSVVLMHVVVLRGDDSWVGFRAGQMILVAVPALTAAGLAAADGIWRKAAITTAVLALLAGAPTTAIDVYNAQDITNLSPGPGFPWTEVLDPNQREALEWLRRTTPDSAVVQLDAIARGRTIWSIIPSFAERRQAAGTPRTLVADPEYQERSERVRAMYATTDAREAWNVARALRIDYVWIDEVERATYPAGMAKFEASAQFFAPVFRNARVTIVRVMD